MSDTAQTARHGFLLGGAAVCVLAGACAIFFWDAVTLKGVFFYYDHALQNFPYRQFFARGLGQGQLRLWTDALFCGFPLFAEGQANPLYPLFLMMFGLFEDWVAYNLYTVVHFFLAGLFAYVLARTFELGRPAAVVAGLCYMLCGPLAAHAHHTNIVVGIAYLPLLLALIEVTLRRGTLTPVFLLVLAAACLVLGAQPQYVLYNALVCAVFLLWRLRLLEVEATDGKSASRAAVFWCCVFAGAGALALGIAAAQLLPLVELVRFSSRGGGHGPVLAMFTSISPAQWITLFLPHYFGEPALGSYWGHGDVGIYAENALYVGVFPLMLAAVGAAVSRRRSTLFFVGLAVFSFIFCLGVKGSVYLAFGCLPLLSSSRFPARFAYVTALCVAMLAARGMEALGQPAREGRRWKPVFAVLALGLFGCVVCLGVAGACRSSVIELLSGGSAQATALGRGVLDVLRAYAQQTLPLDIWRLVAAACGGTVLVLLALSGKVRPAVWYVLCGALVFAELLCSGRGAGPVTDPAIYREPPQVVQAVEHYGPGRLFHYWKRDSLEDVEGGRVSPVSQGAALAGRRRRDYLAALPLNSNLIWRVPTVNGFCPLQPRAIKALLGRPDDLRTVIAYPLSPPLDLLGARYVLTCARQMPEKFRLLEQVGGKRLYENTHALPRAFIVHRAEVCEDMSRALTRLQSDSFDYRATVLLHSGTELWEEPDTGSRGSEGGRADLYEWAGIVPNEDGDADRVKVVAYLTRPGYLVLADQFYPGWEVSVDGRAAELLKADYMLRAVRLPPGRHVVRFEFRPKSFRTGVAVSIASLLLLAALVAAAAFLEGSSRLPLTAESAPLTGKRCTARTFRLVLIVGAVFLLISPLYSTYAWRRIPWSLSPVSYLAGRSLTLSRGR